MVTATLLFGWGMAWADSFSEVVPWNGAPMHMALTPDGNVLTFGSTAAGEQGGYEVTIWNPRMGTGPASRVVVPNGLSFNSFCTAVTLDPARGSLLISGSGTDPAPVATGVAEYRYASRSFATSFPLKYPRYYATSTVLPSGRIHMVGGALYHGNQLNSSPISEVFTPGRGWTELPGTAKGPQRRADGVVTGNPMWYPHVFPVRGTEVFIVAGKFQYFENYAGTGAIRDERPFTGPNWGASSGAVMFRPGQVMHVGGGSPYNNWPGPAGSNVASIFDLRGVDAQGRTTVSRKDTYMRLGRHWATPTVLPNGEVLITGGSAGNNTLDGVANTVEIYNPANGQWRTGAALSVPRLYHSSAMLMKDGRVVVGGGGAPGPIVGTSIEIYTPDYLANAGGVRPAILSGPSRVALGQAFNITTDRAINRMTLVKVGSVTHGLHMDQRFFEVTFKAAGNGYTATFPNDSVNATPGLYMLFAFDSRGVPSEGKFVRLPSPLGDTGWDAPGDTPTSAKVPMSPNVESRWEGCAGEGGTCAVPSTRRVRYGAGNSFAYREVSGSMLCTAANFGFDPAVGVPKSCQYEYAALQPDAMLAFEPPNWPGFKVRHANFLGYIHAMGTSTSDLEWGNSRWIARRGRADPACYTFEASDWPGYFFRHQHFRMRIDRPDGSATFDADTTFCPRPPLNKRPAGGAVSLESKSWPGYFLHHVNHGLGISPNNGTAFFADIATFFPMNPQKAMASDAVIHLEPSSWPGFRVRHGAFMGMISAINIRSSAIDQANSAWVVRSGLANGGCQSFESTDWPGYFLRHSAMRIRMDRRDGSGQFDQDATFCPRPPLTGRQGGQAVTLEALNLPGHFMVHRAFGLMVAPNDGSEVFKTDATYIPQRK